MRDVSSRMADLLACCHQGQTTLMCGVLPKLRYGTLLQIYLALLLSVRLFEALYHEEKSIMNQLCLIISPRDH